MTTRSSPLSLSNRRFRLLTLCAIVALAAVLRFYELGRESLWFDEAFSVNVAAWEPRWIILKLTDLGLFHTDRNIFNLKLHYILLHGRSEVVVRAISAISGVLSVIAIYALGRRLFGPFVGIFAALLLAISPMSIWFSREARAYSLLTLFGILAAYFLVRALADNSIQSWLGYVVLAALSAYTLLFGLLIIVAHNIYALVYVVARRSQWQIRRWLLALAFLAIALAPLVPSFLSRSSAGWGSWITENYGIPTVKTLATTMGMFSFGTGYDGRRTPYLIALVLFAVPCLVTVGGVLRWLVDPTRRQAGAGVIFALLYLIVPISILFLAAQVTPIYVKRYLLPFVPPYLLIVSYGVMAIPQLNWRMLLIAALLIVTIPGLLSVYPPGQKEDWRAAALYMAGAGVHEGDLIVFYDAYTSIPFNYYYLGTGQQLLISRYAPDDEIVRHVGEITRLPRRVWLVLSHTTDTRLTNLLESKPNITAETDRSFTGLRIRTYVIHTPH